MAFVTSLDCSPHDSASQPSRSKRNLLRRWLDAIMASQQRRADREIARYIATAGFSDASEREIERRFLFKGGW
jgi:hypothetical protein